MTIPDAPTLEKPLGEDFYDIEVHNRNSTALETFMQGTEDCFAEVQSELSDKAAKNMAQGHTATIVDHKVVLTDATKTVNEQAELNTQLIKSLSEDHATYIATKQDDVGLSVVNGKICVTYTV